MAQGFNSDATWRPRGRGFSMGVVEHAGRRIHLTGQVAWDEQENLVGKGDVEAQTRQCFENIQALLRSVGGVMADIVSITTYYTHPAQLPIIQGVRKEYFPDASAPVSTSIMVAGLGHVDFLVELTPIAVVPDDRFVQPDRIP